MGGEQVPVTINVTSCAGVDPLRHFISTYQVGPSNDGHKILVIRFLLVISLLIVVVLVVMAHSFHMSRLPTNIVVVLTFFLFQRDFMCPWYASWDLFFWDRVFCWDLTPRHEPLKMVQSSFSHSSRAYRLASDDASKYKVAYHLSRALVLSCNHAKIEETFRKAC